MADAPKSDLIMMFVLKNGGGSVYAESALEVVAPAKDPLTKDFQAADYQDYSNFFEVQSFDFSMAVTPQDSNVGALSGGTAAAPTSGPPPAAKDQFSRWRSVKESEFDKKIMYPVEFDNFSFTRIIDAASPIFFQACCTQVSFESAALVKRVSSMATGDKERKQLGYLRFDFEDVLLTSFSWNDGELITESCTFICKKLKIQYRKQKPDSSLETAIAKTWDQKKNGQQQ